MSLHYFEQSFRSNTSVEIVAHIWRHIVVINFVRNKFIGDDTKAAARQSPNCIKKNKIWWKTIFNMADGILTPCNVACGSRIMTVNSSSGSAMWYVALGWHATEFAQMSAILEFYVWFRFWPYHPSRHVILHQSSKFYPNWTTLGREKMTSCRFSR